MAVQAMPDGYHEVTPFIVPDGASEFIDFLVNGFGASVRLRMEAPGGKVGHSEVMIGNSVIMVADPGNGEVASSATLHVYVPDVDATFKQVVAAGGTSEKEPEDQFYGDRLSTVTDKWGNCWHIATHVEDVSEVEMMERMQALQRA